MERVEIVLTVLYLFCCLEGNNFGFHKPTGVKTEKLKYESMQKTIAFAMKFCIRSDNL